VIVAPGDRRDDLIAAAMETVERQRSTCPIPAQGMGHVIPRPPRAQP
jgi:hypothetical protein